MPKRNKFSRSHYKLLTMNMGELIPIYCDEVIPSDIWQHRTSALIRVSPQVYPTMHPVRVRIHNWYVPTRLLWDDYEDFFTGGQDGTETPTHPYIQLGTTINDGSIYDYLGIPTGTYSTGLKLNALFIRAYNLIYNEHYRDQDLAPEMDISTASGADTTTAKNIKKVSWEKDRLTTARTTTQRGDDVSIPLTGDLTVVDRGTPWTANLARDASTGSISPTASAIQVGTGGTLITSASTGGVYIDPNGQLKAQASDTGITLEDLRLAIGKQRYMEIMQRAGARYGEYARAIFGASNPDSRLQIPEYLGGGRQTISFSEVLATAEGTNTEVGDTKGHGIAAIRTRRYRRFIPEHGIIMGLMSVVPRTMYKDTVERQLIRDDTTVKEDYFTPQLQGIGDDEIYNKEDYAFHSTPDGVFGYQNRYEEYRSKESGLAGEMNSSPNYNRHLARIHSGDISLNATFVNCAPSKRIHADTTSDALQMMVSHSIQCRRPIGRTGLPSKI